MKMDVLQISIAIYTVIGVAYSAWKICETQKQKNKQCANSRNRVESNRALLTILDQEHAPAEYARAFEQLAIQKYVEIHNMGNKGNKYDDQMQAERYAKGLTIGAVKNIKQLKGNYV